MITPVHVDLDFTNVSLRSALKSVEAKQGSLVLSHKSGKFLFSGAIGDKVVRVTSATTVFNRNGFIWSSGVRYDAGHMATFFLGVGQDVGSTLIPNQACDYQHYARLDANFHLL